MSTTPTHPDQSWMPTCISYCPLNLFTWRVHKHSDSTRLNWTADHPHPFPKHASPLPLAFPVSVNGTSHLPFLRTFLRISPHGQASSLQQLYRPGRTSTAPSITSVTNSPNAPHSNHTGLLAVPQTQQTCPWASILALLSSWNTLLPDTYLTHLLWVSPHLTLSLSLSQD